MANEEHLKILQQGVAVWNEWREKNPKSIPDLSGADLGNTNRREANLIGANLSGARLSEANLIEADLTGADLSGAKLRKAELNNANLANATLIGAYLNWADLSYASLIGANLSRANLYEAKLSHANLTRANLSHAYLYQADLRGSDLFRTNLRGADLSGANLSNARLTRANLFEAKLIGAQFIGASLENATLTGSLIYGVSVWDVKVNDKTKQENLIITLGEPTITVDNIKVAQFIYLLLNNQDIRDVIDTITSKAVLILGRFSDERKRVLDGIRDELRKHNYLPIMFDFDPTANQTIIETVKTLAGMSRFVIADITDARSVPQELQIIDTHCRTVAVRLIKKRGEPEYGMLDFRNSPWFVKGRCEYDSSEEVIASIKENIIVPAEAKVRELRQRD